LAKDYIDSNENQLFQYNTRLTVSVVGCMPAVRDVYEVLTAFVAGMTVQDVCSRLHPRLLGIDERHINLIAVHCNIHAGRSDIVAGMKSWSWS